MAAIPYLDSIPWGAYLTKIMSWMGYALLLFAVFGSLTVAYFLMQYKYKISIMQRGGTGNEGTNAQTSHAISRITKDRAKEFKDKDGVVKWRLLFARRKIPPIAYEFIYPGKNVFLYRPAANIYKAMRMQVSDNDATLQPVPADVDLWAGLELREASQEYNKLSAWEKYGNVAVMMGTVLFCLILVGVTVYYTYQHANGVTQGLSSLTAAIQNVNLIPGR